jgi:hypothetical protein
VPRKSETEKTVDQRGRAIDDMMASIQEINRSSGKISRFIGVISSAEAEFGLEFLPTSGYCQPEPVLVGVL